MGTFIDTTHKTVVPFEVIFSGCDALVVPFQQLLEGPTEVLLCERVNDAQFILYVSVAFFPILKQNFIAYRSSKVSSRLDCIFEIHQV